MGAFNNEDPPNGLEIDECTIANNVEFFHSTLGERRKGMQGIDMAGSNLNIEAEIVHVGRHFPTAKEIDNQLWAIGATENTSTTIAYRDPNTASWTPVTPATAIDTDPEDLYDIQSQSFDEKLFLAAHLTGDVDRELVWDGTDLRLAGLSQPSAGPVVTDEGVGVYAGTRYFRVRFIRKSGSTILLRSEPSSTTTFGPSGTGAGATINIPPLDGEGETHWEIEASINNADYYVIQTLTIGTTTYNDETDFTVGYADQGELSEDIGSYTLLPNARFLAVDDDRLLLGGSFVDESLSSRVFWTPVRNDPGVGNNERVNAATDYFLDLDAMEGGGLTGITNAINGAWYAFKWSHIYKMNRTGNRTDAYTVITISKVRGAIPGSIVQGMDEYGRPCIYFLDPKVGPSRIGVQGLQQIHSIRGTWKLVNANASTVSARSIYYGHKYQVWWWVATEDSNTPNLMLKLQVNNVRETQDGVRRGWSTADGTIATALTACVLTEEMVDEDGNHIVRTGPIMGYTTPNFLQRGDLADDDNGNAFIAKIRTSPLFANGLLNRWGAMTAALLAKANGDARIQVKFIKNFGLETNHIVTDLTPIANEEYVIKTFDDLIMSDSIGTQVEFSDVEDVTETTGTLYHEEPTT